MPMSNAERQARHRHRLKLAAMASNDDEFLTRLFGPQLPPEVLGDAHFVAIREVDWIPGEGAQALAISGLVMMLLSRGMGDDIPVGWSFGTRGDRRSLSVYSFRAVSA